MFSHIIGGLDREIVPSTKTSDLYAKLKKRFQQSEQEYKETQETLEAAQKAVEEKLEKLDLVEKERRQLMSEMAFQMQTKDNLNKKLEELNNVIAATDFDLKKNKKMKLSSTDLEKTANIKKIFLVYKSMLKLYFDFSSRGDGNIQRGYVYNKITKNIVYFEFNTDEKTPDEISDYLWNKIFLVSNKNV